MLTMITEEQDTCSCGIVIVYQNSDTQEEERLHLPECPLNTSAQAPEGYNCQKCGLHFTDQSRCKLHEKLTCFYVKNALRHKPVQEPMQPQLYKCRKCGLDFVGQSRCRLHEKLICRFLDNVLKCVFCGKTFDEKTKYDTHKQECHCKECRECYKDPVELTKHMVSAHPCKRLSTYVCDLCGKCVFTDKDMYELHRKTAQCAECNKCFYNPAGLKQHLDLVHVNRDEQNSIEALNAGQHVEEKPSLEKQELANANSDGQISVKFLNSEQLSIEILKEPDLEVNTEKNTKHLAVHVNNDWQQVNTKEPLEESVTRHVSFANGNRETPILVDVDENVVEEMLRCSENLKNIEEGEEQRGVKVVNVEMNHPEQEIFKCSMCGFCVFTDKTLFDMHQKTAQCQECNKCFYNTSGLRKHNKEVHPKRSLKFYSCDLCDRPFSTYTNLELHKQCSVCKICNKCFRLPTKLQEHNYKVHCVVVFKCELCGQTFQNKKQLQIHEDSSVCHKCKKCFPHSKALWTHDMKYHRPKKFNCNLCKICHFTDYFSRECHKESTHCNHCRICFCTPENLKKHLEAARHPKKGTDYPCGECGVLLETPELAQKHAAEDIEKRTFKCDYCEVAFKYKESLKKHVCGQRTYECENCGRNFRKRIYLTHHRYTHDPNSPRYSCPKCDKTFSKPGALREHLERHNGVFRHSCKLCSLTFYSFSNLKRHKDRIHSKERENTSLECHICSRVLSNKGHMKLHLRCHERHKSDAQRIPHGGPAVMCHICGKKISRRSNLLRHLETHTPEIKRTFICQVCGKGVCNKWNLKEHIRAVHSGGIKQERTTRGKNKPSDRNRTKCQNCFQSFGSMTSLMRHLRDAHRDIKPYSCSHCKKKFRLRDHLSSHMRALAGVKPHLCTCGRRFTHKTALRSHIMISKRQGSKEHSDKSLGPKNVGKERCEHCYLFYNDRVSLLKHLRLGHLNIKPYFCSECCLSFCHPAYLTSHKLTHVSYRPFTCLCGKRFTHKTALKVHQKTHSMGNMSGKKNGADVTEMDIDQPAGNSVHKCLQCKYCNQLCGSQFVLVRHYRMVHRFSMQSA